MSNEFDKWAGKTLPPMPGSEKETKPPIEGIPVVIYLKGKPVEMSTREALAVMAQIINVFMCIEEQERIDKNRLKGETQDG
jgi:hypothetical protein